MDIEDGKEEAGCDRPRNWLASSSTTTNGETVAHHSGRVKFFDRMTAQHVTRFLARLATDGTLRTELASGDVSAVGVASTAAQHGFDFSPQELLARVRPLSADKLQAAARKFDPDGRLSGTDEYVFFLEEVPMSKDALAAFLKKAVEDQALQKKLVELASAEGFDFSSEELSDVDLDSVAGGFTWKLPPATKDPTLKEWK